MHERAPACRELNSPRLEHANQIAEKPPGDRIIRPRLEHHLAGNHRAPAYVQLRQWSAANPDDILRTPQIAMDIHNFGKRGRVLPRKIDPIDSSARARNLPGPQRKPCEIERFDPIESRRLRNMHRGNLARTFPEAEDLSGKKRWQLSACVEQQCLASTLSELQQALCVSWYTESLLTASDNQDRAGCESFE